MKDNLPLGSLKIDCFKRVNQVVWPRAVGTPPLGKYSKWSTFSMAFKYRSDKTILTAS